MAATNLHGHIRFNLRSVAIQNKERGPELILKGSIFAKMDRQSQRPVSNPVHLTTSSKVVIDGFMKLGIPLGDVPRERPIRLTCAVDRVKAGAFLGRQDGQPMAMLYGAIADVPSMVIIQDPPRGSADFYHPGSPPPNTQAWDRSSAPAEWSNPAPHPGAAPPGYAGSPANPNPNGNPPAAWPPVGHGHPGA